MPEPALLHSHRGGGRANAGVSPAHGADSLVGGVQILAEEMDYLHAGLSMLAKEVEQVLAPDESDLDRVEGFGSEFVIQTRQAGAQAEDLARTRDAKQQTLSAIGGDGELSPSPA